MSILELTLEEWQQGVIERRDKFKVVVESNFPNKWPATEVCLSVYSQLWVEDITQPFALILVAVPSSKKTTILNFFDKLDYSYLTDNFTPKSFVSHSASVKREELGNIDLLPRIKDKCFITPELAPVFGASEDDLLGIISILTRVMDGHGYSSDSGVHGQRGYKDPIMFVWLGAIVDIPYRVWKVLGNLGSRLYFLRLPAESKTEDARLAGLRDKPYMERLKVCREACAEYIRWLMSYPSSISNSSKKGIAWNRTKDSDDVLRIIIRVANLLARLRAVVQVWETEGTQGSKYAFSTPIVEDPERATNALYNLAIGHAFSCARTQVSYDDLSIVINVALSSASRERTALLGLLLSTYGSAATTDFETALKCSKPTALKTMKELEIIGLCEYADGDGTTKPETTVTLTDEFRWFLSDEFKNLHRGEFSLLSQGRKEDNKEKKGVSKFEIGKYNLASDIYKCTGNERLKEEMERTGIFNSDLDKYTDLILNFKRTGTNFACLSCKAKGDGFWAASHSCLKGDNNAG